MKRNEKNENDDVEEMLRAAQDELLLNLSVNSRMTRVAPDYLLPDLDRRFQALKSRPSASKPQPPQQLPRQRESTSTGPVSEDELLARFAALKGSSSSSGNAIDSPPSDDDVDEVEKIIRWAKDAARLDPSPPSDDDVDETERYDDDSDKEDRSKRESKK